MLFQPAVCLCALALEYPVEQCVKIGAMIHVPQMGHFMCYHRAAHGWRGHDEPPA